MALGRIVQQRSVAPLHGGELILSVPGWTAPAGRFELSRRKVVKRKSGPPPASEPVAEGLDQSLSGGSGVDGEDSYKLQWKDLMADLARMILSAHEADPHRFDEPRDDAWKKSFGFVVGLLIGGAAAFTISVNPVVW